MVPKRTFVDEELLGEAKAWAESIRLVETLGHPPDFLMEYHFIIGPEGRPSTPPQGYRSDFWYENDFYTPNNIFMIHPEFLDETGAVILRTEDKIAASGMAQMWVIFAEMGAFLRKNIRPGMKGYFMEGARKTAECTVIEILGLESNPDSY